MKVKNTLSTTNARKKLFQLTKEVQVPGVNYTFTESGVPKAVLVSAEEFESMQETLEILAENPHILSDIKTAEDEYARGEYVTLTSKSNVVSEKKAVYVPSHHSQKRGKTKK